MTGNYSPSQVIFKPRNRQANLNQRRRLKMARSAHAYVRGSTVKFYEWLESSRGKRVPHGPGDAWRNGERLSYTATRYRQIRQMLVDSHLVTDGRAQSWNHCTRLDKRRSLILSHFYAVRVPPVKKCTTTAMTAKSSKM